MNFFKILLGTATILIIIYNIIQGILPEQNVKKTTTYVDSEPSIKNKTNSSITIEWQSQEKEIGSIQYGLIQYTYYTSKSELGPTNTHEITLEHLSECTKYYYHISSASMLFDKEEDRKSVV